MFISRLDPNTGNISVGIKLDNHRGICLRRPARLCSDFSLAFKCLLTSMILCVRSVFFVMFWFSPFWRKKVTWCIIQIQANVLVFSLVDTTPQKLRLDPGSLGHYLQFSKSNANAKSPIKDNSLAFLRQNILFLFFKLPTTLVVSKRRWHKASLCSPSCHVPRGCVQTHAGVVLI